MLFYPNLFVNCVVLQKPSGLTDNKKGNTGAKEVSDDSHNDFENLKIVYLQEKDTCEYTTRFARVKYTHNVDCICNYTSQKLATFGTMHVIVIYFSRNFF